MFNAILYAVSLPIFFSALAQTCPAIAPYAGPHLATSACIISFCACPTATLSGHHIGMLLVQGVGVSAVINIGVVNYYPYVTCDGGPLAMKIESEVWVIEATIPHLCDEVLGCQEGLARVFSPLDYLYCSLSIGFHSSYKIINI